MSRWWGTAAAGALALVTSLGTPAAAQDSVATTPQAIVGTARIAWSRWPDFGRYVDVVGRLYAGRDAPIWLEGGRLSPAAHGAIGELIAASSHGLAIPAGVVHRASRWLAGAQRKNGSFPGGTSTPGPTAKSRLQNSLRPVI